MFARLSRVPPWAVLTVLVAASTGLRAWGGQLVQAPWYTPDELIYGDLGRSLWTTGKLAVLGATSPFYSLVYPAFAGLPLSVFDLQLGYDVLKGLQAFVMSLTAVLVYLWGRGLMRPGWALAAAALTLAVPGLAFSGFMMTEVVFYPVLTLAAWAAARALADPTPRRQALLLGAVLLAALTRLQALVLVPAFVLALGLDLAMGRRGWRAARPFVPGLAGLLGALGIWVVVQLARGGHPLGAYAVVGQKGFSVGDGAAFVAYHGADLLWMLGVIPVLAVTVLVWQALARGEADPRVRAYLAVAASFSLALVVEVGLFASRYVGRLAERDLIGLSPLLLLGFGLWLDRAAPRPRRALAFAGLGALALFLALPLGRFVVEAAIPDAYTTAPFYRLHLGHPGIDVSLLVVGGAAVAVLLFAVVPRRFVLVLPAVVFAYLAVMSVSVSRAVALQAESFWPQMVGSDLPWVDRHVDGPVGVVYVDDPLWNRVWFNQFWNERIRRVYDLGAPRVLGPMPQTPLEVAADGRVRIPGGAPDEPYALTPSSVYLAGTIVAEEPLPGLVLWRPELPWRMTARLYSIAPTGQIGGGAVIDLYDCAEGTLHVFAVAPGRRSVSANWNGRTVATLSLRAGEEKEFVEQAPPASGSPEICRFSLHVPGGIQLKGFRYDVAGRPPVGRTFASL
ncbi:MAG: hypothetical protein QOE36_2660 [Gaiellaceae bacterium]|nr:hypothetical protein [Gaiellaceae bacterium]